MHGCMTSNSTSSAYCSTYLAIACTSTEYVYDASASSRVQRCTLAAPGAKRPGGMRMVPPVLNTGFRVKDQYHPLDF